MEAASRSGPSEGRAFALAVQPASGVPLIRHIAAPRLRATVPEEADHGLAAAALMAAMPWVAPLAAAAAVLAGAATSRRGARQSRVAARATGAHDGLERGEVGRGSLLRGLGLGAGSLVLPLAPPPAAAKSLQEAQEALTTYGLPDLAPTEQLPAGWSYVVEPIGLTQDAYYGKFKLGSEPLIITFVIPPLWVISRPNIDYNGSAGTVQANDYGKGDSATLFVDTNFKGKLTDLTKKDYYDEIRKALTQKGKGFIEDLKILKVSDGAPGYKTCEYAYEIESGAGFAIKRIGMASFTQIGETGNLQIFWSAVTAPRWEDMKGNLSLITGSFRLGKVPSGVKIATVKEFKAFDEDFRQERKS